MFEHKSGITTVVLIIVGLSLVGCGKTTTTPEEQPNSGLANPASVYCEGLGYQLELRSDDKGSFGICVFPDGSECDEWDFLSGRCGQEYSYCVQQGYVLEVEEEANIGKCVFPDGSSCRELDFFEGLCEPGG